MYHARVLAASHSIYGRVVTEGALLYTDCPKNSLSPLLQGQPARPGVASHDSQGQPLPGVRLSRLPGRRGPVRHVPRRLAGLRAERSSAGGRIAQPQWPRPSGAIWDTWMAEALQRGPFELCGEETDGAISLCDPKKTSSVC